MSAAHVRRGGSARAKTRKPTVQVPKKIAKKLPVDQARANRLARLVFGAFIAVIGVVALIALDIPSKAATSVGVAAGRAGFSVGGYQIVGLKRMDRSRVDAIVADELQKAAEISDADKPAQLLVDVSRIRERLLQHGWIQDARVSRRLPDTLVIDIVERKPAALWQDKERLALVDADGIVLDRVPITQMPDLPLLIGPGANLRARELDRLMSAAPTLKPQLASARWVGQRRWDLLFQSGETVALPEGTAPSTTALVKFAEKDKSDGLLGRGLIRFDLRRPGTMTVQLPRVPEPADADAAQAG
jgi:cell division protein FtsQ